MRSVSARSSARDGQRASPPSDGTTALAHVPDMAPPAGTRPGHGPAGAPSSPGGRARSSTRGRRGLLLPGSAARSVSGGGEKAGGEMGRPILFLVNDQQPVLDALAADLGRRFGVDYQILAERSPAAALATLDRLVAASEEVA